MKETTCISFLNECFPFSTGDVLQLSFPLCGAVLFPGQGFNAEGVSGWYRPHVHSQGETDRAASSAMSKNTQYQSHELTFSLGLSQLEKMLEPQVWREAATQVFFALGLGFGGVIAFSSYNKIDNNCHFDAVLVSVINFLTSILATLVVFAVLGFKANIMNEKCVVE